MPDPLHLIWIAIGVFFFESWGRAAYRRIRKLPIRIATRSMSRSAQNAPPLMRNDAAGGGFDPIGRRPS